MGKYSGQSIAEVEPDPYRYRPLLRPASFCTLPEGMAWDYVEAPAMEGLANRPDLPRSRHRFGIIVSRRKLTPAELRHFDLEQVG